MALNSRVPSTHHQVSIFFYNLKAFCSRFRFLKITDLKLAGPFPANTSSDSPCGNVESEETVWDLPKGGLIVAEGEEEKEAAEAGGEAPAGGDAAASPPCTTTRTLAGRARPSPPTTPTRTSFSARLSD